MKKLLISIILLGLLGCQPVFGTVSGTAVPERFAANGSSTTFNFDMRLTDQTELAVIVRNDSTGVDTSLILNVGYTLSATNNDFSSGGTLTTTETYASGNTLILHRNTLRTQEVNLIQGQALPAESTERTFDKQTMAIQDIDKNMGFCVKVPKGDPTTALDLEYPSSIDRASKVAAFTSTGGVTAINAVPEGSVAFSAFGTSMAETTNVNTARTLLILGYLDARAYGVSTGNSAADNATALQAANDAANGAKVFVPVGSYAMNSITIDNCVLTGSDPESTIFKLAADQTITVTHTSEFEITGKIHKLKIITPAGYDTTALNVTGKVNRQTMVLDEVHIMANNRNTSDVTAGSIGLLLDATDTAGGSFYVTTSSFGTIIIEGYEKTMVMSVNEASGGSAFINSNTFEAVYLFNGTTLLTMDNKTTDGALESNVFTSLVMQAKSAVTDDGLVATEIKRNNFNAIRVWDWSGATGDTVTLGAASRFNRLVGDFDISNGDIIDSGVGNIFVELDQGRYNGMIANDFHTFQAGQSPNVSNGNMWFTTTTDGLILRFDNGVGGQEITVISKAAIRFDTSLGTRLIGSSDDISTTYGDITKWVCETGGTTASVWRLTSSLPETIVCYEGEVVTYENEVVTY